MPSTFTIDSILDDNIGLMYFNPTTETLKEIDSSSTYITCRAFTYSIKRFYLCGTSLEYTNDITIRVSTSDPDLYTTKVISGGILVNKSHFDTATDELVFDTSLLGTQFTNAIPIDILIDSQTLTEKVINLNIELLVRATPVSSTCTLIPSTITYNNPEPIVVGYTGFYGLKALVNNVPSVASVSSAISSEDVGAIFTDLLSSLVNAEVGNVYDHFDIIAHPSAEALQIQPILATDSGATPEQLTIQLQPLSPQDVIDIQTGQGSAVDVIDVLTLITASADFNLFRSCFRINGDD